MAAGKQIYLHRDRIDKVQTGSWNSVIPGMILSFKYKNPKAFDKNPLILFLWFEKDRDLIHSLNLNYLTRYKLKRLFRIFNIESEVVTRTSPNASGQLYENYTWVKLPGFSKLNPQAESQAAMNTLYNTTIRQKLLPEQGDNIYRTYKVHNP